MRPVRSDIEKRRSKTLRPRKTRTGIHILTSIALALHWSIQIDIDRSRASLVDPNRSRSLSRFTGRSKSFSVALALRWSIQIDIGRSRASLVDPNRSRSLSRFTGLSKSFSVALALHWSIQIALGRSRASLVNNAILSARRRYLNAIFQAKTQVGKYYIQLQRNMRFGPNPNKSQFFFSNVHA